MTDFILGFGVAAVAFLVLRMVATLADGSWGTFIALLLVLLVLALHILQGRSR